MLDGRHALLEPVAGRDQRQHADFAGIKSRQRAIERPAARAEDRHFINDDRCQRQRLLPGDCRLQHDRAAGSDERQCRWQPCRRARTVDDDFSLPPGRKVRQQRRADAESLEQRQLFRMLPDERHVFRKVCQHLRAQIAQATVAEHDDAVVAMDRHLCRNLKRRGDGFGEDREVGRHLVGDEVQVLLWNGDEVREGAVVIEDAEDGPVRTVRRSSRFARRTGPAAAVDLADDAPAFQRSRLGDADELVAKDTGKSHVPANELHVRVAHTRAKHADEDFSVARSRIGIVVTSGETVRPEDNRAHGTHHDTRGMLVSGPFMHAHAVWVRVSHWIVTAGVLTLGYTGFVILMAHPRLYWGDAGNDLTPALIELPITPNHRNGGWAAATPLFEDRAAGPVSANRTYNIFNKNGWGRSLHFLAAWIVVLSSGVYFCLGVVRGHFRAHIWPARAAIVA